VVPVSRLVTPVVIGARPERRDAIHKRADRIGSSEFRHARNISHIPVTQRIPQNRLSESFDYFSCSAF
jgi:hypothetical protein